MYHIILSALALSIVHASIPNHWLPLVAIAKVEKWNRGTTLLATAISGFAHIASTILIGIFVGWAGYKLTSSYSWVYLYVAPAILVGLGLIYLFRNFSTYHQHNHFGPAPAPNTPFAAVVFSLSVGMFFSPCIELESYYFTAGTLGWVGIIGVSIVYLVVTVSAMMIFVAIARHGINKYNVRFLEKNEKAIIGAVLILVGLITYFTNLH